jgi:UDP-N-acetyl-2-amino-2-deoxyglucuronate dehydrogenase
MKFHCNAKGFIYPKHKESLESVGGIEVSNIEEADWEVILTPNYLHYENIIEAINKGKNVLCEKPLCLSLEQLDNLIKISQYSRKKIYTVFQLRHHPVIKKIPRARHNEIQITIIVPRGKKYFETWKGQEDKSGGILYNLGIHYLDLVLYMFGDWKECRKGFIGPKESNGYFSGDGYSCDFTFSYESLDNKQRRIVRVNGQEYDFSESENLHKKVYQDLDKGKGIDPCEVKRLLELMEELK